MDEPSDGVFGNLPASRPGSRSPRRDGSGEPGAEQPRKPPVRKAEAKPPPPPPPPPAPRSEAPPVPPAPPAGSERVGGVEDLAWAGVTVAARAATVGVKLVGRALEAARTQVERPPRQ